MEKVSIVVLAYNQLGYTKLCIDSLYIYTSHIDFELITVNNGSSDGTKEYFDSLPNDKKINFDVNVGIEKAMNDALAISEGEYFALINNDIILTENWLDNLLKVLESDPKIGVVVPACNNSSQDQIVFAEYYDTIQLQEFASKYNKSDYKKWEERLTLIMYLLVCRTKELKELGGLDPAYSPYGVDDHDLSFTYRRAGFKLIYARDTYVHHYRSVTLLECGKENGNLNLAPRNIHYFKKKFGINFKYQNGISMPEIVTLDYRVLNRTYNKLGKIDMLGIGKTCGNTLLRVKNKLREQEEIQSITLNYYCLSDKFLIDLKTICDKVFLNTLENINLELEDREFDYIHIDEKLENIEHPEELLKSLRNHLKDEGEIIFFFSKINSINIFKNNNYISFKEILDNCLDQYGYTKTVDKIEGEDYMYVISADK